MGVQRLIDVAGTPKALASFLISAKLESPPCVCGSSLVRIDSKARCLQFLQQVARPTDVDRILQQSIRNRSTSMICDLCDENIPFQTYVWTCRNKDRTMLHATTYDVCDTCFIKHV